MKNYITKMWFWIPYTIGLIALLLVPYKVSLFESEGQIFAELMIYIVFPVVFTLAIYGTIKYYKHDKVLLFKRLSVIPWVIVGSHMVLLYGGKIYGAEGGHWVLYLLIMLCSVVSFLLYMIAVLIKIIKKPAV